MIKNYLMENDISWRIPVFSGYIELDGGMLTKRTISLQGKYRQHGLREIHHCHCLTTSHTWAVKTLIAVIAVKARRLMSLRGGGSGRSGLPAAKMHYVIITGLQPFYGNASTEALDWKHNTSEKGMVSYRYHVITGV